MQANLGKYLPGNIAHFVERSMFAAKAGMGHAQTVMGTFLEIAGLFAAAAVAGMVLSFQDVCLLVRAFFSVKYAAGIAVLFIMGSLVLWLLYQKLAWVRIFFHKMKQAAFWKVFCLNLLLYLWALLLLACWRWTGVNILYFLAGLQSISTDIYEAASIDGASKWQQFVKISFPLVKPTTVYVLTISIYAGLSMFTESYMLWKGNNSPQNIGLTIVGYLYRQGIEKRAMGYACAVGLILLIIVMAVNLVQLKATGTFDKEER